MAVNRLEAQGGAAPVAAPAAGGGKAGGLKPWLPLLVSVVLMPALAYATAMLVLLPRLQTATGAHGEGSPADAAAPGGGGHGGNKEGDNKPRQTVQLNKVLVNVSGSMGTRYLLGSYTLVGSSVEFRSRIEGCKDQLLDLAAGVMSSKTIADVEKPGARNLVRNELMTVFNNALGGAVVREIYVTEFVVQ
jgi:flagellar FliL protein